MSWSVFWFLQAVAVVLCLPATLDVPPLLASLIHREAELDSESAVTSIRFRGVRSLGLILFALMIETVDFGPDFLPRLFLVVGVWLTLFPETIVGPTSDYQ